MLRFLTLAFCLTSILLVSRAQTFRINEVMSSNGSILTDSDGESSDWIEFYNSGPVSLNLNGYGLSDKKDEPYKWLFPNFQVESSGFLVLFASGKDRRIPPLYWNTVISQGDSWKYLTPTSEPTTNWRISNFDDSKWPSGKSGFGFADNDDETVLSNTSVVFLRKSFTVGNPASVSQLILHMDYDDGFVAYLNGIEVARVNMAGRGVFPRFDVLASASHEALIYQNQSPEKFEIPNPSGLLKSGTNILAIQVHNNSTVSSDLSAIPFLSIGSTEPFDKPRSVELIKLPESELHTNFKIDADGESLYLTNLQGELIDSVRIGSLGLNLSYGRTKNDPTVWGVMELPTPGLENTGSVLPSAEIGIPVFSLPGGIYSSGQKVALSSPNRKDSVYYTLDGSEPTRQSARAIREIDIPTSKVLKARILKSGVLPGKVVTNSYIIYNNKNLPVVSLSMNPSDLWDYNTGIYVLGPNAESANPNFGANFWQDWEKACHVELFESGSNKPVDQDAGIKIFGNWSRANAQKSLVIHARKSYGKDLVKYKIFDNRPFDEFKSFVLRNSGNDWNNTMFRDGLVTSMTIGLNFNQMAYRPSIVFLNGEYWGIQNIREKIDEHFLASNDGVNPDEVILLENNGQVLQGSADDWWTMYTFVENNSLAVESNYQKVAAQIDVSSFIDYFSSQIFYVNWDWPGNNIRYWKTTNPASKWRWIMFDTDFSLGIWNSKLPSENSILFATDPNGPGWPNPPWSTLLLRKLLENNGFRNQFVNRFADLMNSRFLAENINKAIDEKSGAISAEIGLHLKRWSGGSQANWAALVQAMKSFVTERPYYVFTHIQQKFKFQNPQRISVLANPNEGSVQLNSLKLTEFPWRGAYFNEVPIRLKAIPNAGFRFVKWEGVLSNSNSSEITLSPKALMEIRAVFESDGSHNENIVINEISFNNDAEPDPGDWIEIYNKGTQDIDLSGWKLTDSDSTHRFVFAPNTWIRANDYLVVSNDINKLKSVFGGVPNLIGTFEFGLGKTTDAVKLFSVENQLIDEVCYSNVKPWKRFDLAELWSLELSSPLVDNNAGQNWDFSPGYGTPGARNALNIPSSSDDIALSVKQTVLSQNYPNPFNDGTYIDFKLDNSGSYKLVILDMSGKVVRLLNGKADFSGEHSVYWDGKDESGRSVTSGVYIYRLESAGVNEVRRMVKM